ncbi:MAG: DNA polymerase III subunit delta [Candidatus Gracilibacteria bacterium]
MGKPNFYLMVGDDTFSLLEEATRWKNAFVEKFGNNDLEEFDGDSVSVEAIKGSLLATPFLSEKRLVILKNFLSSQKTEISQKLIATLEKIPDTTFLLMTETASPDKRTVAFKAISSLATNRLFLKPKGAQMNTWIIRHAESLGGKIDSSTAGYLANWVGDDLFSLYNEIQKLTLFARGEKITIGMIDSIVADNVQSSIFTLTDALGRKDGSLAIKTLKKLQNQGQDAVFIFSMIARQFRLLLEMKTRMERGSSPAQIARDMQVHPFVVENTLRFSKNFTVSKLKKGLAELLKLDKRLKTGAIPLKPREEDQYLLALERILINL